ncbi:type I-F CRISPR-associated protein Csy2 [Methylobacter sp. YRD-M1]|uniref:type I-F CRISPR-associated protein Csy2 n=1 Tax=Methylobacter sp. YRD-M1 TaxID=2911520 RepID=UPI00227B9A88|nr:type I-F CRISPR-associated protein Csy2 [Methylobacter sp. YRD-M1]WAK04413.1 type I-F CRISPR-associated protein Csy2 [Methylobacter sp. YRD-M1]
MRRRFLLIPHLQIHNANAMSSPYTIGFPALTAWLGAVHALQRYLQQQQLTDIELSSVGISCHRFDLQTYKGPGDFVYSIVGTANPLDKDGSRPAFVEEARCHLEVSLLIELQGLDNDDRERFETLVNQRLRCMKWASGDVLDVKPVEIHAADEDDELSVKKLLNRLMLGYVLIERRELIMQAIREEGQDALDALLGYLKVMHRSSQDESSKVTWSSQRKAPGWLVPIAVGFQSISGLGRAANQRDSQTPHRFAESVVTLGEFKMPYRIENLDDVLWQYHADTEQNLYLCRTLTSSNLIGD